MKSRLDRETIAMRIARELEDSNYVNLGAGIPSLVAHYILPGREIIFQSENGIIGFGAIPPEGERNPNILNADGQPVSIKPGGSIFDSNLSFAMIRGGHIDATVLGGLQVSEKGDLANWMVPEKGLGSIGGAMDLVSGAKKVIVAMEHTAKGDRPKILKECAFPLTGKECVDLIVTDLAVIAIIKEGLVLKEVAPGWTADEVQALTEAKLIISPDLKEMEL